MSNYDENDYQSEKFSAGIWKKLIKLVIKRKKHLILMIIFVLGLAALDVIYPLLNRYAIQTYFSDNPDHKLLL